MISLSGSEIILGVVAGPSVGRMRFEFILNPPADAGEAVLGAVVSVSTWAAGAAPEMTGRVVHLEPPFGTGGDNNGLSG